MFFLAGSTTSSPPIHVSVFWGVFMAAWTMSFVGLMVRSLPHPIQHVFRASVPAQILHPIIGGVWIGKMTSLLAGKWWTNKSSQDQSMDSRSASWTSWESDSKATIFQNNWLQDPAMNCSWPSITTNNPARQRFYPSKTGNLVSFIAWNRQPFFHAHNFITQDAL